MTLKTFERAVHLREEIRKVESEKNGLQRVYNENKENTLMTDLCNTANDALNFKLGVLIEEFKEL